MEDKLNSMELDLADMLRRAAVDQLAELADGLGIQVVVKTGRKSRQIREIQAAVEAKMGEMSVEECVEYMGKVMEATAVVLGEAGTPDPKVEEDARRRDALARDVAEELRAEGKRTAEEPTNNAVEALLRSMADKPAATSLYRRQLKISGSIGGKEQLGYLSLASQVTDAKKSGYSDHEIMVAVKKAIVPSSTLRSYIDSKPDLQLKDILAFLRDFYAEKTAAEWYTELTNCAQKIDEKPLEYILRALETRQRVIAASNAEEGQFDQHLVNTTFCRAARTGLRSEAIRNHMKGFLDPAANIADEIILHEINRATTEENEVSSKQKDTAKKMPTKPVVAAVAAEDEPFVKYMKPLVDSVAELTKQMKEMQTKQQPRQRGWRHQNSGKCKQCQKDNIDTCKHCFKCGSQDGHFARNCKKPSGGN